MPMTPSAVRTLLGSSARDPAAVGAKILAILDNLSKGRTRNATGYTISDEKVSEIKALATHLGTMAKSATERLSEDVAAMRQQLANLSTDLGAYTSRMELLETGLASQPAPLPQPTEPTSFAAIAAQGAVVNSQGLAAIQAQKHTRRQRRSKGSDRLTLCQIKTKGDAVFTTTPATELTSRINEALKRSQVKGRSGATIQAKSTARHPSQDILVIFHNDDDAKAAREHEGWVKELSTNLRVQGDNFVIVIQDVAIGNFDPTNEHDVNRLKRANPGLLDSAHRFLWAASKKVHKEGEAEKSNGSLIVHLADGYQANGAISRGVALDGQDHTVYKSRRPIIQCHNCQHFGHTAARCAKKQTCGRCASNDHSTKECNCKEDSPCTDFKNCTHIRTKCALCQGDHRAGAEECVVRIEAETALQIRNKLGGEFFLLSDN